MLDSTVKLQYIFADVYVEIPIEAEESQSSRYRSFNKREGNPKTMVDPAKYKLEQKMP